MHFTCPEKLRFYLNYLETIDVPYYAAINGNKGLEKVIILPVAETSVNIAFTVQEFELLKETIHNYLMGKTMTKDVAVYASQQTFCLN
jgi:hypothetical protein